MLRKAIVKEKISEREYLVEDVFDKSMIRMMVSGKQRMYHKGFEIGEDVYVSISPYKKERAGRFMTSTDFKMNDDGSAYAAKIELDRRHETMKKQL